MDIIGIVLGYVQQIRYPLLFVLFLAEGPLVGFTASVLAARGQFDIWIVYFMYLFTEIFVDTLLFYIGVRFSESKLGNRLENTNNILLKELKISSKKFFFWVLFILKISPFAVPGLLYLGGAKVATTKKLFFRTSIITIISNSAIVFLGYKAGLKLLEFTKVYNMYQFVGLIALIFLFASLILKVYKKEIEELLAKFLKKNMR